MRDPNQQDRPQANESAAHPAAADVAEEARAVINAASTAAPKAKGEVVSLINAAFEAVDKTQTNQPSTSAPDAYEQQRAILLMAMRGTDNWDRYRQGRFNSNVAVLHKRDKVTAEEFVTLCGTVFKNNYSEVYGDITYYANERDNCKLLLALDSLRSLRESIALTNHELEFVFRGGFVFPPQHTQKNAFINFSRDSSHRLFSLDFQHAILGLRALQAKFDMTDEEAGALHAQAPPNAGLGQRGAAVFLSLVELGKSLQPQQGRPWPTEIPDNSDNPLVAELKSLRNLRGSTE